MTSERTSPDVRPDPSASDPSESASTQSTRTELAPAVSATAVSGSAETAPRETAPPKTTARETGSAATEPPRRLRDILILAEDPTMAAHVAHQWALATAGEPARAHIVHTGRRALRGLPSTVKQVHLGPGIAGGDLETGRRLVAALRGNPTAAKVFARAAEVVVPAGKAGQVRRLSRQPDLEILEWTAFVDDLADVRRRQLLRTHQAGAQGRAGLAVLLEEALAVTHRSPATVEAIGRAAADLLASSGYRELSTQAPFFARLSEADQRANGLPALLRIAQLSLGSGPEPGDVDAARSAFDAAMDRVDGGDLSGAVRLVTLGLRLVFHSELHADGPRSLIVEDATAVLAPWRESRFGRYAASLTRPQTPPPHGPGPAETAEPAGPGRPPRVVVLAGAYGSFFQPVVDVLTAAGLEPDVVLADDLGPMLKRRDPTEQIVGEWLRLADPPRWCGLPEDRGARRQLDVLAARLADADVVFADWCDPGALFASHLAPESARLVVRMHRVDATKAWAQFVRWPRVAAVLLVSEHVRAFVAPQLASPGEPLPTPLVVVNNIIDVERYRRPKHPGAERAIAMVGWGRRVKDPIFAVETLRELLADDPTWRLHLIGRDFADSALVPVADYLERFRALTADPTLRDAIVWVGFTQRLEEALDACGFALSTSVVEGWPVGVVEAAVSGCVPVIRDWPQVAAVDGARTIYAATPDWVVSSPREAAARIRAYADPSSWAAESARSRAAADALSSAGATAGDYLDVILGPWRVGEPAPPTD